MKKYSFLLICLVFTGCASVAPKGVPQITSEGLPALDLKGVSPGKVALVVQDTRPINVQAQNTKEIEDRIAAVLTESLAKDNVAVDPKAATQVTVVISDYNDMPGHGECVGIEATFRNKRGYFSNKAAGCYEFKNAMFGYSMGGDISEAYKVALTILYKGLNEQSAKFEALFK